VSLFLEVLSIIGITFVVIVGYVYWVVNYKTVETDDEEKEEI